MSKIRILALPVDREPYITNIENSLKNMQTFRTSGRTYC